MNAHPDLNTLALLAGGDLDPAARPQLILHVNSCAVCQRELEELECAGAILRTTLAEPSEADLRRVRQGLSQRLTTRRRTTACSWSLGITGTALVLLFTAVMYRPPEVSTNSESVAQLPLPRVRTYVSFQIAEAKQRENRSSRRHSRKRVEAGLRTVNFARAANGFTQIRLTTTDPNVLIILPSSETAVEQ